MTSSRSTRYTLCCQSANDAWLYTRELRYSLFLGGWVYPCPAAILKTSFTWHFCPWCNADLPPFEPTRPWNVETEDD